MTVGVFSSILNILESKNHCYPIKLKVSNEDSESLFEAETINGLATFANLNYPKSNFNLIISSEVFESIYESIKITGLPDIILNIANRTYIYYTKQKCWFDAKLYKFSNSKNEPIIKAQIKIFLDGEDIDSILTNNEGSSEYYLIFNASGNFKLEFIYDDIKITLYLEVLSSSNQDNLCLVSEPSNACEKCVTNAYYKANQCECYEKMTFNYEINECECIEGYVVYNGICASCGFYLKPSEITAEYSEDYFSIIVTFSREVNIKDLDSCSKIILSPLDIISISKSCHWVSSKLLKIDLNNYPKVLNPLIELNSLNVQSVSHTCSNEIVPLNIDISLKYPIPSPSALIMSLDKFSLKCSQENLEILSQYQNSLAQYNWVVFSSPSNPDLENFIEKQTEFQFEIPRNLLLESTIKISLTVILSGLETFDKSSKTIEILNQSFLSVTTNLGNYVKLKSSQECFLFAIVTDSCGNLEEFNYKWSITNVDISELDSLNQRADSLLIPSNFFKGGKDYKINLEVAQGKISGSSFCIASVEASELVLTLSRSSGSISQTQDFQVGCEVKDFDEPDLEISKKWFCVEENGGCKDSSGNNLKLHQNDCLLIIKSSDLKPKATYFLSVKAERDSKEAWARIEIYVDPEVQGVAQVIFPSAKINPFYVNNLIPKIEYAGNLEFKWNVIGGNFDSSNIDLFQSFIGFPEYSLEQGVTYKLELKIQSDQFNSPLVAYGFVISNLGPICSGLNTSEDSGRWKLIAEGCTDGDNEDYPLSYQFGYELQGPIFWLNEPFSVPIYRSQFHSSIKNVSVRVFDAMGTWNTYSNVINSSRRLLRDYLMEIMGQVSNPSNIPNVVIQYSLYDIDYPTFSFLYSSFFSYFKMIHPTYSSISLFISSLSSIMRHLPYFTDELLANCTQLAISTLDQYKLRLFTEESLKLIEIFSSFADRIDTQLIFQLFDIIGEKWVIDAIPNIELKSSGLLPIIKTRKIAQAYIGYTSVLNNLIIDYPQEGTLNKSIVYDTISFIQNTNYGHILHFYVKNSGTYEDYNLKVEDSSYYSNKLKDGIKFSIDNSHSFKFATCKLSGSKSNENCVIEKVNKTNIILTAYVQGSYIIEKGSGDCKFNKLPITISSMFLVVTSLFLLYFFLKDKNHSLKYGDSYKFKELISILAVFQPKRNPYRMIALSRISAKVMALFALMGLSLTSKINLPLEFLTVKISFFDIEKGIVSLLLIQILNLLMLIFSGFKIRNRSSEFAELFLLIIVSLISLASIIIECLLTCTQELIPRLYGLLIIVLLELILLESFWALLVKLFFKKKTVKTSKVTQLPIKELKSDGYNLNETENFSPRVFMSSQTRSSSNVQLTPQLSR